ncbi:glucosamine-6-phosphate deaminase [Oceanicella sp. SM1341]|uniref:glucosamine-6-phosphate deaminase n=1 Tax=Oceanicella sp. SM1341 TaxID=1548889 RepID=UPI000E4D561A|nr:glucosamine-6-phosphate deaminase [Oceanicella sp. SM1341]
MSPLLQAAIRVLPDAEAVAGEAARLIGDHLAAEPAAVLGLATGRTPLGIYRRLAARHAAGGLSFARATSFNLDEYRGLGPDHPASFAAYMRRELFGRVDLPASRAHVPPGLGDAAEAAARYEAQIAAAGGIGLQLLGIGRNGHIGFNEPGAPFDSRTREVVLDESTREANAPDFPPGTEVPARALTMGIGTILEARRILLVATGAAKAEALRRAFRAPPDTACPASALTAHPDLTLVCDRAAAALL